MKIIKLGIIGYGDWVKNAYIPCISKEERAEIIAISAKSDSTCNIIKSQFDSKIAVYKNFKDLLKLPEINAVMIAVPDGLHAEIIVSSLEWGKDIFYEPPLGSKRSEIPHVIQRLIKSNQITQANLELVLIPVVTKAKNFIEGKLLGNIQNIKIELNSDWGDELHEDLNNVHRLSLWYTHVLNYILNDFPDRVLMMDGYGTPGRRQSQSSGFFDYSGIWGELKININSIDKLRIMVTIIGSTGKMKLDLLTGMLKYRTIDIPKWIVEYYPAEKPYAYWPGVRESVKIFIDSVISRHNGFANAKEVAKLHMIGLASEKSLDAREWVDIEDLDG